jgi:hypothetical protein
MLVWQALDHLSDSSGPFLYWLFFWDRVSQTICPDWLQTVILLISASWIAGITGVSHWRPASSNLFWYYLRWPDNAVCLVWSWLLMI